MMASTHKAIKDELVEDISTLVGDRMSKYIEEREAKVKVPEVKWTEARRKLSFTSEATCMGTRRETLVVEERQATHIPQPHVMSEQPASTARPVQKPPTFDGRSSWEAYITQFEIVADLNRWSMEDKAVFLAASLKGQSTTVLSNMSPDDRTQYPTLITALESRFGNRRQSKLHRLKLRSRLKACLIWMKT